MGGVVRPIDVRPEWKTGNTGEQSEAGMGETSVVLAAAGWLCRLRIGVQRSLSQGTQHKNRHHMMTILSPLPSRTVRTTVNLDDALLEEAVRLTGISNRSQLLREGLVALIQRESASRLARLGGTEPQITGPNRRRDLSRDSG